MTNAGAKFAYLTFFLALISTLGSLYFSEILQLVPCTLCWYQRIAMFPIALISAIGIMKKEKKLNHYILPFSVTGFMLAFYHNLLYYHILPESFDPCVNGISCTTKQLVWFGFITIPFMSLLSFGLISISMLLYMWSNYSKQRVNT